MPPRASFVCFFLDSNRILGSFSSVIVKASSGPRYVVGCRKRVDKTKLTAGTRVALDMTTLTVMRVRAMLPLLHDRFLFPPFFKILSRC